MTPPGALHFLMSRYRVPHENLYGWGEGGAELVRGHGGEKLQVTVEIMENKRTICYCVLECANALLYSRAGERELLE